MASFPPSFMLVVDRARVGERLDRLVAAAMGPCSRSYVAALIRQGSITVNGVVKKPGYLVKAGEAVSGTITAPQTPVFLPEAIPLEILYEDTELLVVNKPAGMVVHPAPGHRSGTLANAVMHHCPDLPGICGSLRPGIVHRLDKDTSGALVVAKNSAAMNHLAAQFKSRKVTKRYLALVYGVPTSDGGTIALPIGRHPVDRKKMSGHSRVPRPALTHWRVVEVFSGACLLEVEIHTGRTHQIRVHCRSMGHPVIGDPVYGSRGDQKRLAEVSAQMGREVVGLDRQMLHARHLAFVHPLSAAAIAVEAPLPPEMAQLIQRFRFLAGQP